MAEAKITTFKKYSKRIDGKELGKRLKKENVAHLNAVRAQNREEFYKYFPTDPCSRTYLKEELNDLLVGIIAINNQHDDDVNIQQLEFVLSHPLCDISINTIYKNRPYRRPVLSEAVAANNATAVRLLLARPECASNLQCHNSGETALHSTVDKINPEIMRLLLDDVRTDPCVTDSRGRTVLTLLAYRATQSVKGKADTLKAFQVLMEYPKVCECACVLDESGESVLSRFLKWYGSVSKSEEEGHYIHSFLDCLLQSAGIVNAAKYTLPVAIELSSLSVCAKLLEHSADANSSFADGESCLHVAVRIESCAKIKLLLLYKADVWAEYQGRTALYNAIANGCGADILEALFANVEMDIVATILEDTAFEGESLLTCAVRHGVASWIEHFRSNENEASKDGTGLTALKLLCKYDAKDTQAIRTSDAHTMDFKLWYAYVKKFSVSIKAGSQTTHHSDKEFKESIRQVIRSCDAPNTCVEAQEVRDCVMNVAEAISEELATNEEYAYLAFSPLLAGSSAERTKTFTANEVDVICRFLRDKSVNTKIDRKFAIGHVFVKSAQWAQLSEEWWMQFTETIDGRLCLKSGLVATEFYKAVRFALNRIFKSRRRFGNLHLKPDSLHMRDKISYLQLLWRGDKYKDMLVYVDLVPSFTIKNAKGELGAKTLGFNKRKMTEYHLIAKISRHDFGSELKHDAAFHFRVSYAREELGIIADLPARIRRGLTVAKALRISAIAGGDVAALGLTEKVSVEDFITSYMLKNALFHILDSNPDAIHEDISEYAWSDRIFEQLEKRLRKGALYAFLGKTEILTYCKHDVMEPSLACCFKKRICLKLCLNIRKWLKENMKELENTDKIRVYSRTPDCIHQERRVYFGLHE